MTAEPVAKWKYRMRGVIVTSVKDSVVVDFCYLPVSLPMTHLTDSTEHCPDTQLEVSPSPTSQDFSDPGLDLLEPTDNDMLPCILSSKNCAVNSYPYFDIDSVVFTKCWN